MPSARMHRPWASTLAFPDPPDEVAEAGLRDQHLFGGALDFEDGRVQLVAGCHAPRVGLTELLRRRGSSGLMRIMQRAFSGVLTCDSHIESGLRGMDRRDELA